MSKLKHMPEHLFCQMKKLDERTITSVEANAQVGMARQINNYLRYELAKAKSVEK